MAPHILYPPRLVRIFVLLRIPFGLRSASATFQRILNSIYCDYLYKSLIIYVDDVILYSNSQQEALAHCKLLFQRASTYGIQFKPTKCTLLSTSLDILGHHISSEGRKPTNSGITAIAEMPRPTTPNEVKRFLGLVGYFREYIQNMHFPTSYLRSLLKKDTKFYWTAEHEQEFNDLKNNPDILLYHPNWDLDFEIHTDASKKGVGSMLAQRHNGHLRLVRFASKVFSPNLAGLRWIRSSMLLNFP